ncbi:hypothetical protein BBC0122_018870 [Bartonella choladocola]|uniref:Uncharacterized protein n=1 Tax=Bartonella choladocola TaxID=2750995 RepID=A0A1U9MJX4_9HYPH|nr:hypothetical protein BBC0122_018870 [Bartonella choladocola]
MSAEGYWGYRCPRCQTSHSLKVQTQLWVLLVNDGWEEDDNNNPTWSAISPMMCESCQFRGNVHEFHIKDSEWNNK